MRHGILPALAACLLWCAAQGLAAQDYQTAPVTVSTQKIRSGGKIYYFHPILEKQTLYSICKAYQVSIEELYAANPEVKEGGLKTGGFLLIPVKDKAVTENREKAEADMGEAEAGPGKAETGSERSGTDKGNAVSVSGNAETGAERTETDKGNAVSVSGKAETGSGRTGTDKGNAVTGSGNAETGSEKAGGKAGKERKGWWRSRQDGPETGRDGEKENASEEEVRQDDDGTEYTLHRVRWYEDIDDIALRYRIPADYILAYNHLTGKRLKARMKLKIPKRVAPAWHGEAGTESGTDLPEEGREAETAETEAERPGGRLFGRKKALEISLLLPFDAARKPNDAALDFYEGFLLALRQAEEPGGDIRLNVYDCAQSLPLTEKRIAESDMIIGPISTGQLKSVLEKRNGETPVISPLDIRAAGLADAYGGFIHTPPRTEDQYRELLQWIREDFRPGDKVLILSEKNDREGNLGMLRRLGGLSGLPVETFSYELLEGREVETRLAGRLSPTGVSRILLNSENEAFTDDLLRNLNILLHKKQSVVLYCTSKVRSFDTIDIGNLHRLRTHMANSYFADFSAPETRDFVLKYRALYNDEPSRFAFQGHDIAAYFTGLYRRWGVRWQEHLPVEKASLLQASFDFTETGTGSFLNNGIRRVIYEQDYTVRMLK